MSLCTTCQSLDLLNIPKLPASCNAYNAQNESAALISVFKRRTTQTDDDQSADEPLGLPFYNTLEDLQAAAKHCSVCKVIEQDISRFQNEFVEAKQKEQLRVRKREGPDWKMWLAKGTNEISGFMVVSTDVENKAVVWVLSAVGLCVDDDDPLNNIVAGRKIDDDALSDTTSQQALGWIQECDAKHGESKCLVANADLPLSVIDVNSTNKDGLSLYTSHGETGRYAALSHVDDSHGPFNTIGGSAETHNDSFAVDALPQIYQDAITMTRKLGLRYLWIDAVCIPQADLPSWSRSSPLFASIYTNAYVTLSTTYSPNSPRATLTTRSPPPYTSFPYTHASTHGILHASPLNKEHTLYPSNHKILSADPYSEYAWALQERLLSPRILHFTSTQLYFECNAHFVSENGFEMTGRIDTLDPGTRSSFKDKASDDGQHANLLWQNILNAYCRRKPPAPQDKLPALANIAERIARLMHGDTYIAGLWRTNLIEGMIWQATGHAKGRTSESEVYRAPSWSWASIDGPFGMFCLGSKVDEGEWSDMAEVKDVAVTLKKEDEPFGEVKDAWVRVCGPLEELSMCGEKLWKQVWRMRTRHGDEDGAFCIFDTAARAEQAGSLKLYALVLTKGVRLGGSGNAAYHAIIVAPVVGKEGMYVRMGKVVFDDKTLGECEWMEDGGKMVDAILV